MSEQDILTKIFENRLTGSGVIWNEGPIRSGEPGNEQKAIRSILILKYPLESLSNR